MLNNIRGILNRRSESQSKSPDGSRVPSEDDIDNNAGSMEGFLCPSCKLRFPAPEDLQDHYESIHSERELVGEGRVYSCSVCKMKFGSEIELDSHFSRHHSSKEDMELEAMSLQVKALEEGKALLQGELQAFRMQYLEMTKENSRISDERDNFKLETKKMSDDVAVLKQECDELKTAKASLESSLNLSKERIKKLEVEMHQRPEADDVSVLQKELVAVQTMMNEMTLQREAEKDLLQTQCDSTRETCLKLQAEKTNLENLLHSRPKNEEVESMQGKVRSLTENVSHLQKELSNEEMERKALHDELKKCSNNQEMMLSEKNNILEEVKRHSSEKDVLIEKLKKEIDKLKENIEEMKIDREKLFSKIEEGEGVNAAMNQLREENAKLKEEFLQQQELHAQTTIEHNTQVEELHSSLKLANTALQEAKKQQAELENKLTSEKNKLKTVLSDRDETINKLKQKIGTLADSEMTSKALESDLREEIKRLKENIKEEKLSHDKRTSLLEIEKQSFEKRLAELGSTLPKVQADLLDRENRLAEADRKLQKAAEALARAEREGRDKEDELRDTLRLAEESKTKIEELSKAFEDFEESKVQFSTKICSLNEELMNRQLKESELSSAIEALLKEQTQMNEKCAVLEEENNTLRASNTSFQNEKNSLLNNIEKHKKHVEDLRDICAGYDAKLVELTYALQSSQAEREKVIEEAKVEKEVFVQDKLKLQKQIENLEIDCAKQLSESQAKVESLETKLSETEEKIGALKSSLAEAEQALRWREAEWEEESAGHVAKVGVLTQNVQTLRSDLQTEQRRREAAEQKLDEACGTKLELEAKLENALDERKNLLERCLKNESECERLQKSSTEMLRKYEDCVAALQELGRENQTLQVENLKLTNRKWTDDTEVTHCTTCGKLFTVTVRKHHCRHCGNIFCNECSSQTATIAASKNKVRVCDICYDELIK